jgi:hypothetical protein
MSNNVVKNSFTVQVCGNTCPHVKDSIIKQRLRAIISQQWKGVVHADPYRPTVETAEQIKTRSKAQEKARSEQTAKKKENQSLATLNAPTSSCPKQESPSSPQDASSKTESQKIIEEVVSLTGNGCMIDPKEKERKLVLKTSCQTKEGTAKHSDENLAPKAKHKILLSEEYYFDPKSQTMKCIRCYADDPV